jgi:hypothetical protein
MVITDLDGNFDFAPLEPGSYLPDIEEKTFTRVRICD